MDENNLNNNGENENVEKQGNTNGGAGNQDNNNKDSGKQQEQQEKMFNQDQVSRMMTREKKQGMAAAYKELGIDPNDAKAVKMVKALIASQKTDEQKAAEDKLQKQQAEEETNRRVLVAEAKAEAMMLGIKRQYVDDAVALAMSKMSDDTDIKTLLGEYKTKYPVWFDESSDDEEDDTKPKAGKSGASGKNNDKGKAGQRGTGSSIKGDNGGKKGNKAGEEESIGKRLAARRKASAPKTSFWS